MGYLNSTRRQIRYAFCSLTYTQRISIAVSLHLIIDEDERIKHNNLITLILDRAMKNGKELYLWDAIKEVKLKEESNEPIKPSNKNSEEN